ncbi:MAG: ABC transporter ATP-binding protein [Campylobacteraceae bacterium]|jgi:ABC-2 type transport system ATP-binding protein|nr:ABC transporter ATP-binding protein [Campylobacteraceae bacterium]
MLQIKAISKSYKNVVALDNIFLNIPSEGIFALLGLNGAGKTTLISILCNIIKPDKGEILYKETPFFEVLKKDKSLCSLTPQEFAFYPALSIYENIKFFSQINDLSQKKRENNIDFALNVTKLEKYLPIKAYKLSGGLKRRLNLAISLLNDPKILFLDEPTIGIDPHTREFILKAVKEIGNSKKLVFYTSHYMNEVDFLADSIAIIDKGKVLLSYKVKNKESVLTLEINDGTDEKKLERLNSFMPFTKIKNSLQSNVLSEQKAIEFLNFAHEIGVNFKKISFAPISAETLFLNLTADEKAFL